MKILLADDNKVNQLITGRILSQKGIYTEFANNGIEVLSKVFKTSFDLILMDLQMPTMDGIQASLAIRNINSQYMNLPIIAFTSGTMSEACQKIKNSGITDVLLKPYEWEDLYSIISKYTETKNAQLIKETSDSFKDSLFRYSDNDPEFASELIGHFIENYQEFKTLSVQTYQERNLQLFKEAWHKITSSNRIFSVTSMDDLVAKFKDDLASNKTKQQELLIGQMNQACDRVIKKLTQVKQTLNA